MTLFGADDDTPAGGDTRDTSHPPRWVTYSGNARCDACTVNRARDHVTTLQVARWRRTYRDESHLYCYPHARTVRHLDDEAATPRKQA